MTSKTTIVFIFTALVSQAQAATSLLRVNIKSSIEKEALYEILPNMTEKNLINFFNSQGIVIDEKSQIYIHEEKNTINLNCFKCLIHNLPEDQQAPSSYNERALK